MIYIDNGDTKFTATKIVERIDNHNGSFSYRKENGKIFCVNPNGGREERDSPGGPWESFFESVNSPVLVAERDGGNIYLIPFAETK